MGALTEVEIFSCLEENLLSAAQHAKDLALLPVRGDTYDKFRKELLLVEGAARQASVWREDTRWLDIGHWMATAHRLTGKWLRGYSVMDGKGKRQYPHDLYLKMADNLLGASVMVEKIRKERTGRVGMILPEVQPLIRTQGRAVQVLHPSQQPAVSSGGIILAA